MADTNQPALAEALEIEKTFDAPLALIWQALTEEERLVKWWGPAGMKMNIASLDLHPEGMFHYSMQAGDGPLMWGKFVYREIHAPDRLVFVNSFSDEAGGITRHPLSPTWPLEVLNTWTLIENGAQTTLKLVAIPINASPEEMSTFNQWHGAVRAGSELTFNQLNAYLESIK